uniref:Uncharacterized protein n=1 Tax=viral metagenome TaxID=1070528 RepID=A0A6M3K0P6_9ZZZZ
MGAIVKGESRYIWGIIRQWWYRRKVRQAQRVLLSLDRWMALAGIHRHQRRQFWRDFIAKRDTREDIITGVMEGFKGEG